MTRNQNSNLAKRTYSRTASTNTQASVSTDYFAQLPDLSGLGDDEKQHILNVLLRDENLRNKHLSRFMQLRKEVADLEQKQTPGSTSGCSLCQTAFGFLFNTGDTCPKCGERVCKQCRLIYNVNDNGWLCKLCCKQMQLMSYSGEWVYSSRSNLRKDSVTASEVIRKSLSPTISYRNLNNIVSSSDTETDENVSVSGAAQSKTSNTNGKPNDKNKKVSRMIVQSAIDEKKLNSIKKTVQRRPYHGSLTDNVSSPKPTLAVHLLPTPTQNAGSSDEVDSVFDQSTNYTGRTSRSTSSINLIQNGRNLRRKSSLEKSTDSLSTVQNEHELRTSQYQSNHQQALDCASVTSSEWGADDTKSEREGSIVQSKPISRKHGSKKSLSSRIHLTSSVQSIRDAVGRIPREYLSGSRTSLNSEKRPKSERVEKLATKDPERSSNNVSDEQFKNGSKSHIGSSRTLTENVRAMESLESRDSTGTVSNQEEMNQSNTNLERVKGSKLSVNEKEIQSIDTKPIDKAGSSNNLDLDNSDDDIDKTFEKVKMDLANRASSCMDMRGSQISIASALSETTASYGLEISGTIELKLTYIAATGALDIFINKCKNLARAKRHGADPYIKIYLLPDRSHHSKRKSSVKKNTVDPIYEEKFRYHLNNEEFKIRVLWISVWSQSSLGQNDFLGEIHVPLSNCTFDVMKEYKLLAQQKKSDLSPTNELTPEPGEIQFQLTFIPGPKNKDIGTVQVHYIEAKGIYFGKVPVDAICKGLLMPDNLKRKLPMIRKGPAPKWEIPLRWDGVRRDNLPNTSIEISIWSQERFRKFKIAFVRLNLAHGHFHNRPVDWSDATKAEKSVWESFIQRPTLQHRFRLPLRPVKYDSK